MSGACTYFVALPMALSVVACADPEFRAPVDLIPGDESSAGWGDPSGGDALVGDPGGDPGGVGDSAAGDSSVGPGDAAPTCGDHLCDVAETCDTCPADCGLCCEDVANGLLAFWQMEGDGKDSVGNLDLTTVGGVAFEAGRVGLAARFDGGAAYLTRPHQSELDFSDQVSFAFWARVADPVALGWGTMPFSKGEQTQNDTLAQFNPGGPTLVFQVRFADSTTGYRYAESPVDAAWHHYVMVYERGAPGEDLRLYVDGTQQLASANNNLEADQPLHAAADVFRIGGNSGGSFSGWIDQFRLHAAALSDQEIAQLAACPP